MMPAGIEPRAALRSMERFGKEVMPVVRKAIAADTSSRVREPA
jgi:hypothetical protein